MDTPEEIEDFFNRMDKETEAEIARQNNFIAALEKELVDLSIRYFPETEPHKHHFIAELTKEAHYWAVIINEDFDMILYGFGNEDFIGPPDFKVPDRDITEKEKKYLEDTLKNMPAEQHEFFIKLNTERVKYEAQEHEFKFQCFDKTKELIVQYFPEIVDFSANSIRNINFSTYVSITEFVSGFYYLTSDYRNGFEDEDME